MTRTLNGSPEFRPMPVIGDIVIPNRGVVWNNQELAQEPHVVLWSSDIRERIGEDTDAAVLLVVHDLAAYIHLVNIGVVPSTGPHIGPEQVAKWASLDQLDGTT